MIAKTTVIQDIKLADFPEEIDEQNNIKVYGETSWENQLAVLSHYLHNNDCIESKESKREVIYAIREFLEQKKESKKEEITDEYVTKVAEDPTAYGLFSDFFNVPFPDPKKPKFTFIDLFAGMGGFRLAMQAQGGKCVFSSEWNKYAQKTYLANFGEMPFGGVSKKKSLGRETGFKDKTQGTLFFDVADIISRHRPKAFFLENVKNLMSHDKGNTFKVIKGTLEELRYSLHYLVMDGQTYVPQHRERIMIVGFNQDVFHGKEQFAFPEQKQSTQSIKEILDPDIDEKYTLSDKLWSYLQNYAEKHRAKGNGFGFGMVDLNGISRTLSARYYKDGSEILIPQTGGKNPRRLSPRECARLMGYPDEYRLNQVSDVQAYRQCGNSVVVPLITAVSEQLVKAMLNN